MIADILRDPHPDPKETRTKFGIEDIGPTFIGLVKSRLPSNPLNRSSTFIRLVASTISIGGRASIEIGSGRTIRT